MKDNTQEKNLIEKNENNNIFGKIKNFFRKIFGKKEDSVKSEIEEIKNNNEQEKNDSLKEYIKRINDEETEILELQMRYRRGEIADNDLTQEQINSLCMLYDKQIKELKRTIKAREQQLSKYKKMNKQKVEENNG